MKNYFVLKTLCKLDAHVLYLVLIMPVIAFDKHCRICFRLLNSLVTFEVFFLADHWLIWPLRRFSRQRCKKGKGTVFTTALVAWLGFNQYPGYIAASLDKTLYDDYLCLVASANSMDKNSKKSTGTLIWITGNLLADFPNKNELLAYRNKKSVYNSMVRVWPCPMTGKYIN